MSRFPSENHDAFPTELARREHQAARMFFWTGGFCATGFCLGALSAFLVQRGWFRGEPLEAFLRVFAVLCGFVGLLFLTPTLVGLIHWIDAILRRIWPGRERGSSESKSRRP